MSKRQRRRTKGFGSPIEGDHAEVALRKLLQVKARTGGEAIPPVVTKSIEGGDSPQEEGTGGNVETKSANEAATPAFSKEDLGATIAASVKSAVAPLMERIGDLESKQSNLAEAKAAAEAQLKELEAELTAKSEGLETAAAKSESLTSDLKAAQDAIAAKSDEVKAKASEVQSLGDRLDAVEKLWNGQGAIASPSADEEKNVQFNTGVSRDTPTVKEYRQRLEGANAQIVQTNMGGFTQRDLRAADEFLQKNRPAIRETVETQMKAAGFLRGSLVVSKTSDLADLPDLALDYLSGGLRMVRSPRFIFHQFAKTIVEVGKVPTLGNILIPRFKNLAAPTDIADYRLAVSDVLGATTADIQERSVACPIEEWGRGKVNAPPVSISTFISAYSLLNLESQMYQVLGQNYLSVVDLQLRTLFDSASYVLYANGDGFVSAPGDVSTDGTFSRRHLIALNRELQQRQVAPLDDGKYVAVLNIFQAGQLTVDLDSTARNAMANNSDVAAEMLSASTNVTQAEMSGYLGSWGNFHLFSSNAFATEAPGAEGVQTETLGTGPTTTRTGYAFGREVVGRGVALPVEIRVKEVNDFARKMDAIWYSHEGFCALDVNADAATHSEIGVIKFRTTDEPVA